jgi:MurNAc alpha-1-phosphate uridylyltransferase
MRAMILAAGRGQRLSPLTDTQPKPLIKVGDRTLIEHQLSGLKRAGISEVVINTGWLGQQLIEKLGCGKRYGLQIEYSIEPQAGLETGGGIYQALPLLGNAPFLIVNADIFHTLNLKEVVDSSQAFLDNSLAHLVLVENPSYHPEGDFCIEDHLIKNKSNGLPNTRGQNKANKTYTYTGIGMFKPELFINEMAGRFALAPLLKKEIKQGKISGDVTLSNWFDAGTRQRIAQIEKFISDSLN